MLLLVLVAPLFVVTQLVLAQPQEPGFDLLFTTNPEEHTDAPVTFPSPIPTWLKGTFIRDGPASFEVGSDKFQHDFDGFAKLASWKFFGNDTVLFSTKFIRSEVYVKSMQNNKVYPAVNVLPLNRRWSFLQKMKALITGVDNLIVNVLDFTDQTTKKVEYGAIANTWPMYKFNPNTLATEGLITPRVVGESIPVAFPKFARQSASAHPLPEPGTTNKISVVLSARVFPFSKDTVRVVRMTSLGQSELIGKFRVDVLPFVHSFSVTQTKVIILGSPLVVDPRCSIKNAILCSKYDTNATTVPVYIMDLGTGNVDTVNITAVFSIHHINAYDEGNNVIVDLCSHCSPQGLGRLQLKFARDPNTRNLFDPRATMKRITIDTQALTGTVEMVDTNNPQHVASQMDYPVINEAYRSTQYCFAYGLTQKADGKSWSNMAIVKKDLCNNQDLSWHVDGYYPSEPWFVAKPNAADEDDGILLVPVLDGVSKVTSIVILDAKTMTMVNEGRSPTFIPYTQHGRFFPQ